MFCQFPQNLPEIEDEMDSSKQLAIQTLTPVLMLLDQAAETEDADQFLALFTAAVATARAMIEVLES